MSLRDHIEHLKQKPPHVRTRIAFSAAGVVTLLVAFMWTAALVSSEALAFKKEATHTSGFSATTQEFRSASAGLAGAAASNWTSFSEGVVVVETKASSTLDRNETSEATIIPF